MNAITLYLAGAGVSLLLSGILMFTLRASLTNLLEELWSSRARAGFWAAVGCVTILLLGVFAGTSTSGYTGGGTLEVERGFFAVAAQLRLALAGLFSAMIGVSFTVMLFMFSADRARRADRQPMSRDSGTRTAPRS